jgi:EAL domain-containing protein (putative c-di-GMP-specific phosphodiesterase class I)/GGDEF domain-containing protein
MDTVVSAADCPVELFDRLLRFDLLHAAFQPIFRITDGAIFGYEGLIRGPSVSRLAMPQELFAEADRLGRRPELEIAAIRRICRQFSAQRLPGHLLLNLGCEALESAPDVAGVVSKVIAESRLDPSGVIIELTEHDRVRDADKFARTVSALRQAGFGLALDDFGSGHSNLQLWMQLRPRLVKLDRVFVHGLASNGDKFEIARFMKGLADSFGTQLVAEGVEHECDLAVVRDMGLELVQGYLLGMPLAVPGQRMAPAAAAVLRSSEVAVLPNLRSGPPSRFLLAGELSQPIPPVAATESNDALARLFYLHSEWTAVAVVRDETPVGVINRRSFMDKLAQPFYRELYGRRPVTAFMNNTPVTVDRRAPLESMTRVLAGADQRYLIDGFVVTDNGRYIGMGTGESLVRAVTEMRIEAARYANPLTFLPGNIPISQHVDRLLSAKVEFVACYADLNHFKPFNDQYGYWRGDEMIRLCATLLQDHSNTAADFVGHVGGDDFLVVFQSEDWRRRCRSIIDEFDARARDFFSPEEIARGSFDGEDRKGVRCSFPLTTLAIGAVVVRPGRYDDHEEVASAAALAKRRAKSSSEAFQVFDGSTGQA